MSEYDKIPQDIAVYVESDPDGNYFCATCMMFVPDRNECTAVCGYISEKGGCNIYIRGKPQDNLDKVNPHRTDYSESGYLESPDGFSCKRCRHVIEDKKECIRVLGKIKPDGCCNFWQRKRRDPHGMIVRMMKHDND